MITLLLHSFYATGLAFLFASVFGALTPMISALSLFLGWWFGRRHAEMIVARAPGLKVRAFSRGEPGAIEILLAVVIFYACLRHFTWLLFRHDSKWMTLSPNNFGDLPLHINYIRSLASGLSFPIANPSFASEPLRYPFGADLYDALWESLGVPLRSHLFLVGVFASAWSLVVLRWFGGWWAMGAFFLGGGGILVLAKMKGIFLPQSILDWKNLLLSVFITQRGVLFALPAGLLLIDLWRRHVNGESPLDRKTLAAVGLVWGLLPLFHAHAFIVVSLVMFGSTVIEHRRQAFAFLFGSRAFAIALVPAVFFVWRSTDGFKKASVSRWDPWWTSKTEEAAGFLWANFGFWLFLPIAIAVAIHFSSAVTGESKKKLWLRLSLACGLFVLFFNWMLAPWSWDNIKLLIWPYLMLAQLANETIDFKLPRFSRYVIAAALFGSGFYAIAVSLATPSATGLVIYQDRDLNSAAGALAGVPEKDAVFLAAPTHEHALTNFGRLRVMGYEGHLWSHGIDSRLVREKVDAIMNGSPEWLKLMRELGVTHVYWGLAEKIKYGEATKLWMTSLENVSRVPEIAIYRLPPAEGKSK
ncbi:MAG: hypothetical protein V4760_06340 [Bdellovibrionota bacterium]